MINYPNLNFRKIKDKYPASGIYLNGSIVNIPTHSFFREGNVINVRFFVPTIRKSGVIDYIVEDDEIASSECKLANAFYGAIVGDELVNIESWVLEFGVDE